MWLVTTGASMHIGSVLMRKSLKRGGNGSGVDSIQVESIRENSQSGRHNNYFSYCNGKRIGKLI